MNKKLIFIFTALLAISVQSRALEVYAGGGLQMVSSYYNYGLTFTMGSNTYTLKEFEDYMKTNGFEPKIAVTGSAPDINLVAAAKYNPVFSYYVRLMYVPDVSYHATYTNPFLGVLDQQINMPLVYFGGGIWAEFAPVQKLHLMLMGDIGYLMENATMKQEARDTFGNLINSQTQTMSGSTYAFCLGAGAKYYFSGMFYGNLDVNYNSVGSSIFAGLGVGVDLDTKPGQSAASAPDQAAGDPSSAAGLEASGDGLYKQKDYRGAFGYYSKALATNKTAALYMKVGNCYYALGYKPQALSYYNYSLKLQENPNLRAFVDRISAQ